MRQAIIWINDRIYAEQSAPVNTVKGTCFMVECTQHTNGLSQGIFCVITAHLDRNIIMNKDSIARTPTTATKSLMAVHFASGAYHVLQCVHMTQIQIMRNLNFLGLEWKCIDYPRWCRVIDVMFIFLASVYGTPPTKNGWWIHYLIIFIQINDAKHIHWQSTGKVPES